MLFRGCGEENQLSGSVCVVLNYQVYQASQALIPHSKAIHGQNRYMQVAKQLDKIYRENIANHSWTNNSPQHYEPSTPILNAIVGVIVQNGKWEENKTPKLCGMEKDTAKHNVEENYDHNPAIE